MSLPIRNDLREPPPTFAKLDHESPLHLLEEIKLASGALKDGLTVKLSDESTRKEYVKFVKTLSEHVICSFYPPHEYSWSAIHEKIKLTEATCEVIGLVGTAFCSEPDFVDIAKVLFCRLFDVCRVLDTWVDVPDVPVEDGYPTPEELRQKTEDACIGLLRAWGEDVSDVYAWKVLKEIAMEYMALCDELLDHSAIAAGPLRLRLFTLPRIYPGEIVGTDDVSGSEMKIEDSSQLPLVMTSIAKILMEALRPPLLAQWFLADVFRRSVELSHRIFNFIVSPLCITTDPKRVRSIIRIVVAVTSSLQAQPRFEGMVESMRFHLLLRMLHDGPNDNWDVVYVALHEVYKIRLSVPPARTDVESVLAALGAEQWGDKGHNLRLVASFYLLIAMPSLDMEYLREIKAALLQKNGMGAYINVLKVVEDRLTASDAHLVPDDHDVLQTMASRKGIRSMVQAIIQPDELSWMEDDDSMNDSQYISRAVLEIGSRYQRPIYNSSAEGRVLLARHLTRLPCTLAGHPDCPCPATPTRIAIPLVSTCIQVLTCLLNGPEMEVTAVVRKTGYDALAQTIRHQTADPIIPVVEHAAQLAARGMKDAERIVRLSAGRCLAELVRLFQDQGADSDQRIEQIFHMIAMILNGSEARFKETVLITAGTIAKYASHEVLWRALRCLIEQLGSGNPVIKGTAYMQIRTLAKQSKSPYTFLSPFMDRISVLLVSRICTQPSALQECCLLLSVTPASFILATVVDTLPHLFATQNRRALHEVAKEVNKTPHQLFFDYESKILARAFMLPKPGETTKVLNFIVAILKEVIGNEGSVEASGLVDGCLVNLVSDLVIEMGREDEDVARSATQALMKVGQIAKPTRTMSPLEGMTGFLQPHILGIMAHINDELQFKHTIEQKRQICRSLGAFIREMGPVMSSIAPQIMAALQTTVAVPELAEVTLESWDSFLRVLDLQDIGPYIGQTSASFVSFWPIFSAPARNIARGCLEYIIADKGDEFGVFLDEVVDLSPISELSDIHQRLAALRTEWTLSERLQKLLERSNTDSITVTVQALSELKHFMLSHENFVGEMASGDTFDPFIGRILSVLLSAACRDGEDAEALRMLAFDCIGILGAVDPDRLELVVNDPRMIVTNNFADETEAMTFVSHLIKDVLVGVFRSTSDIQYQRDLAYAIQELLKFCKFTKSLLTPGSGGSVPIKVRNRWNELPKHVIETVTPLLDSKYKLHTGEPEDIQGPIYRTKPTYREWIQSWTSSLITEASGPKAKAIFSVFPRVVKNKDVGVARHLLPHLALNILVSGSEKSAENIRLELLAVLEDQVDPSSTSTHDKKELSAQTTFMVMDHLNKWVRTVRHDLSSKKSESKRGRANQINSETEEQLLRVDSILSSIDRNLMAQAALQCKAYARALMSFEQQILAVQTRDPQKEELPTYYERLHEIYAHLDEPDGMEGVSTLILSPSIEHQIRQHESTGRWTAAQSCWEVQLQHSPNDIKSHLGLLKCLRNLGHYDTMRTHVDGALTRNPEWEPELIGYRVESGCMIGDWDQVQSWVQQATADDSPVLLARVLLAMRSEDEQAISVALTAARKSLGAPVTAAGTSGYRRSYEAILDLHLLHELDTIYRSTITLASSGSLRRCLENLQQRLSVRLNSTLPSFRIREPILSIRRSAFGLRTSENRRFKEAIGQSWLLSAKLARKAGYWHTAYSALLQARQSDAPFTYLESAKIVRARGEPLRALQELENSLHASKLEKVSEVIDLTGESEAEAAEKTRMRAKTIALRARWMKDSDRYEDRYVVKIFQEASEILKGWESGFFHFGQFEDECSKDVKQADYLSQGLKMNLITIRCFIRAIRYGTKYIYQTVPRMLTLWLDMGENERTASHDHFKKINFEISKTIKGVPMYKWYTAFPQIVSRVGHDNPEVYTVLSSLIVYVIQEYPQQGLWLFAAVVNSQKDARSKRGRSILDKLRGAGDGNMNKLISASLSMAAELLNLCNGQLGDKSSVNMSKDFPRLFKLAPSPLIIPLQQSLTATLPPLSSTQVKDHKPFPIELPTFYKFSDEIEIMKSLAKPRKICIQGSDGHFYLFLGKPKDDLRKDARLMDFNSVINKLLKSNSESRRRQLRIRTYGVVTLNEECGFIQWVHNTVPVRSILIKSYDARGIKSWNAQMGSIFGRIKQSPDKDAANLFVHEILPMFPPVLHEWFIEMFPEPSAWLAGRLTYSRTVAVMSMIGAILGLGDRHCENILLDMNSGDVVHVDFNCLFDKGRQLETPERVPFRLTQNMTDGLGVIGVEGVFRTACEITIQLLRDNRDCLMSVLDSFVHDPLVEWEEEHMKEQRRRQASSSSRKFDANVLPDTVNLRNLAKNALGIIGKKLKGIYTVNRTAAKEKELSTSGFVQILIQQATDEAFLAKMYPGWAPWH